MWPKHLGTPNAIGSQNNVRYAYFADSHRIAAAVNGSVSVYDALDHHIGGFGQQQGDESSITFTSQKGVVELMSLPVIWRDGAAVQASRPITKDQTASGTAPSSHNSEEPDKEPSQIQSQPSRAATSPPPAQTAAKNAEDVFHLLEKLEQLIEKGYIDEEEFRAKKSELLKRI
ncbi:MAG: SHOCT domain-containing protein [Magnetovibrionaceae bacterium]